MAGIRFFDRLLRAPKRFTAGSHRVVAPATTLRRARRLMRRLGITRLAELTGLDDLGVPVYSAIRPNGKSLSTSQGKGLDRASAAASALMESIETWHAENIALPRKRASLRQARSRAEVIDVRRLPRPRGRLDADVRWSWLEGWDLLRGHPVWVPLEAVTLDCVFPPGHVPTFDVSSNGLASGNHLLEAMSHALCEVIERDAEASWRGTRGQRRLDLTSVAAPACRALLDRLGAAGVHVAAWDLTSDVEVPVYGCALLEDPSVPAWRSLGLYQGFGCHLSPEIALLRALTEAVQTRVTYIAGSRDDFFPEDYARATEPEAIQRIWDEVTATPRQVVSLGEAPHRVGASFEADVAVLIERLAAAGAREVVIVDLSRAELGVPVVKALVPGRATRIELMG